MKQEPREDKIGQVVELTLPPAYGGKQKLKVNVGSSCTQCALSGLGHTTCMGVNCGREGRADGTSVVYSRVKEDD